LKRTFFIIALLIALPYARSPLYDFPAPRAFAGSHFVNPYAGLTGKWQRANLHAHGRAWSGLTNGQQPDAEVVRSYRDLGYAVAGVSDYHRIAAQNGVPTIAIYEHGYNVAKRHQLAIGARRVEWFDFPLWQSPAQEQLILDLVGREADLVAIAHPTGRNAYSDDSLEKLTGYQLIEVVNGPFAQEAPWDVALSSGHMVWGLANDDSHDIHDPRRMAAAWNMIDAPSASTGDIVGALRAGRAYSVLRLDDRPAAAATTLASVEFDDGHLSVSIEGAPATFVFAGQNGAIRKTVPTATTADYTFADGDTYIRTIIKAPRSLLYLNPIVRYDGTHLPAPMARYDLAGTWLVRAGFAAGCAAVLAFGRRRRAARTVSEREPAIAGADRNPA
jgi:hypothetical protein